MTQDRGRQRDRRPGQQGGGGGGGRASRGQGGGGGNRRQRDYWDDFRLPEETLGVLKEFMSDGKVSGDGSNFALLLQRFSAGDLGNADGKSKVWSKLEQQRADCFKNGTRAARLLEERRQRIKQLVAGCRALGLEEAAGTPLRARVDWRLVVGLGSHTPLEAGITLDSLSGIPYLPGSALKGVARSHRLAHAAEQLKLRPLTPGEHQEYQDKDRRSPTPQDRLEDFLLANGEERDRRLRELQNAVRDTDLVAEGSSLLAAEAPGQLEDQVDAQAFREVFGSQAGKGKVTFLDAYPESLWVAGRPILEPDIMNPHYGSYYTDSSPPPPADWHSPVPVTFLTVTQNAAFEIYLMGKSQQLADTAREWVRTALVEHGLGAKTRAGYGYFAIE